MEQKLEDLEAGMNAMQNQMAEEKERLAMVVASITSLTETLQRMEGRLDGLEQHLGPDHDRRRQEDSPMRKSHWVEDRGRALQTSGGNSRFLCFTGKTHSLGPKAQ